MRIVAGKYRSRTLKTLKGENTRPSSDRLKEALFNRIGPYFEGGRFLDLFGGSGAVGLEALSRGMEHVVFVENHREAQKIITENVKSLNEMDHVQLVKEDALAFSKSNTTLYDYIFMDPPYEYEHTALIMDNLIKNMHDDSILIVETRKNKDLKVPEGLVLTRSKAYGMALLSMYQRNHLE